MAFTILPFVIRPPGQRVSRVCDVPAQIIIFPGVRYEAYPDDEGPKLASADKSRRSRRKAC